MKKVGGINKVIRFVPGLILLSIVFFGNGNLKYLGLIGLIPIVLSKF